MMNQILFIKGNTVCNSIAGSLILFSILFQSLQAQEPARTPIDTSWKAHYDSVHTIENMGDLPINQNPDDHIIYSLEGLSITELSALNSATCTEVYNLVFGVNMIFYNSAMYEAISSANMAEAAEKTRSFWVAQKKSHLVWCECISTRYEGYTSDLCNDE